jgi:hypothetical protein
VIGSFQKVQYQDSLQYLLYPWFMVLLFVVSGMSSGYYLEKHIEKEFIRSRTRKLLVPGTIGVIIFGWIQGYYNMLISNAFATLAIIAFMKVHGNSVNAFTGWMQKKSWGLYIFHYLPLSMTAWYLSIYASGMPAFFHYFLTLLAGFAGGVLLYEIISRIPILRWCVLGIKKEKKDVQG